MLVLQRRQTHFGTIDGSCLRPDRLMGQDVQAIKSQRIKTQKGDVLMREVFDIRAFESLHDPLVVIRGNCESIDQLGAGTQSGVLCILGNVGNSLGLGMQGGSIVIQGNALDHLACGMRGGSVYVSGDCRNHLASPMPGRKSGMRDGDIFVAGSVGERACERMRRGTVFVGGDAGDYCLAQMIAGTMIVMGQIGKEWGIGMRRGSLILGNEVIEHSSNASHSAARDFELSYLPLVWNHLSQLQADAISSLRIATHAFGEQELQSSEIELAPAPIPKSRWVQRRIGDLNYAGRGEVLELTRVSSMR